MSGPRYFWIVVAAGLVLTALAVPSAHASCGHYVVIGNPHPNLAPPSPAPKPAAKEQKAPAPVRPCSGPNCSDHRQPLTPPAPKTAPVEEQRWCHALSPAVPPSGGPSFFSPSESAARPVRGCSIYHPPR
jgi:hypothetical protein